jgi:surface antigen
MFPTLASRLGRSGALLVLAVSLPLAAPTPAQAQSHGCDRSAMGQVFSTSKENIIGSLGGAALGGLIGNQFGGGSGKGAMTALGVVGGALAGGYVGRSMAGPDQACVGNSLERVPTGQTAAWRNPDNGAQYRVTPTRTYKGARGQTCRDFVSTAVIDGQEEQVEGTACRQRDGSWKTVDNSGATAAISTDTILRVQQQLRQEGFYVTNNIDGRWGPKSAEALRNFQRVKGLPVTGEIDQQTLAALELAPGGNAPATVAQQTSAGGAPDMVLPAGSPAPVR